MNFSDLGGGGSSATDDAGSSSDSSISTSDSSSGADGAPDGSRPSGLCADGGGFCDDFERTDVQGPWDSITTTDDGVLAIVEDGDAGNHVLQVSIRSGSSTVDPVAYLSKDVGPAVATVTYTGRFFVTGVPGYSADISPRMHLVQEGGTVGNIGGQWRAIGDGGTFVDGNAYHQQNGDAGYVGGDLPFSVPFPIGAWAKIEMDVDLVGLTVTMRVNDTIAFQGSIYSADPQFAPGDVSVSAGLAFVQSGFVDNAAFKMLVDDVSVYVSP